MGETERFPVTVVMGSDTTVIWVQFGENLLMSLINAALPVEFMCTTGKCTTCRCRLNVPPGSANLPSETERYRLGEQHVHEGYRLTCQLYVKGPLTIYIDD